MQAQIVILINCGAQLDLVTDLSLDPASGTKIIVADSHRCAALTPARSYPKPSFLFQDPPGGCTDRHSVLRWLVENARTQEAVLHGFQIR